MFLHSDIWKAIDHLAAVSGFSTSGLAKTAGLDPTTFNKSKRISPDGKPRWPSTESLSKILVATNIDVTDFFLLIDKERAAYNPNRTKQTIPLISLTQVADPGYFSERGVPIGQGWSTLPFPDIVSPYDISKLFALKISGDFMAPLYRDGDLLIICTDTHIKSGDRVIIKTYKEEVLIKEVSSLTASQIDLNSLNNNKHNLKLNLNDLLWYGRIMWVSQ